MFQDAPYQVPCYWVLEASLPRPGPGSMVLIDSVSILGEPRVSFWKLGQAGKGNLEYHHVLAILSLWHLVVPRYPV